MSDKLPAISVIVPAYGVAHLLGDALASLQAQAFADWEAVVVDDGALDDVEGALKPFSDDPRIRLLATDNGGPSIARNRAVAVAKAPYLALLDGDDAYEPTYLTTMLAAIEADPELGFVTCDATITGLPEREGHRFSRHAEQTLPLTLDRVLRRQFNVFIGCIIRKSAFQAVGGFNAELRAAEDLDLWVRLLETGWRGGYVPQPLVRYRRRPGSLSADTSSLLRGTERMYELAQTRLAGKPEARTAADMIAIVRRKLAWHEGEALIRSGRRQDGIALLTQAGADDRSLRWRLAMPLMRRLPWLAPAMLQARMWLPSLFPGGSEW